MQYVNRGSTLFSSRIYNILNSIFHNIIKANLPRVSSSSIYDTRQQQQQQQESNRIRIYAIATLSLLYIYMQGEEDWRGRCRRKCDWQEKDRISEDEKIARARTTTLRTGSSVRRHSNNATVAAAAAAAAAIATAQLRSRDGENSVNGYILPWDNDTIHVHTHVYG
ncbi:unnamed protein product [Trichogramma brassicae]|uniref:Uncharacterized protein n=1 Tax=Trichogramma brassicae TaxID=86971 RepID=A0A6H5J1D6_9HYME|nr:unnamed protein product [Trichogramma brassicae]